VYKEAGPHGSTRQRKVKSFTTSFARGKEGWKTPSAVRGRQDRCSRKEVKRIRFPGKGGGGEEITEDYLRQRTLLENQSGAMLILKMGGEGKAVAVYLRKINRYRGKIEGKDNSPVLSDEKNRGGKGEQDSIASGL